MLPAMVLLSARTASAELAADQVLVVCNSFSAGAVQIVAAYLEAHPDLPQGNVLDLADPAIAGRADLSYDEFVRHLRDPIRHYLLGGQGPPAESICCLLVIRGLPHRIEDRSDRQVGDHPDEASVLFAVGGNATYASVDSELTLLWQDLEAGERGGTMDSYADNAVANPYHTLAVPFDAFDRSCSLSPKSLQPVFGVVWAAAGTGAERLTPGDMLLVCRLDGQTVADVLAALQRAGNLIVNRARVAVVLDENDTSLPPDGNRELDDDGLLPTPQQAVINTGNDYEQTAGMLAGTGWRAIYDGSSAFVYGHDVPWPLIAYASYGRNHGTDGSQDPQDGYLAGFRFAPGAIFNTIESFNGRAFNGLGPRFRQGQLADFVAAGGTFGVGHVYEPFSFAVPDNEFLFDHFLNRGLSWGEAAWSSIPVLSWQHVVIGDPLARVESVVLLAGDLDDDGDVDALDFAQWSACFGRSGLPRSDPCAGADLDRDEDVDLDDYALFQRQCGADSD